MAKLKSRFQAKLVHLDVYGKHIYLSPAIAKILAQGLQRYNSPTDWARKVFKPSTDSASLLVEIEKKFSFWVCGFLGKDVTTGGVIFNLFP